MWRVIKVFLWFLALVAIPICAYGEELTFNSLYSKHIGLGAWALALASAIFAGALVYFTGGAAKPLVTQIATWIGQMAGLSGDAATGFGLALLGGGAAAGVNWSVSTTSAVMAALISFSGSVATEETIRRHSAEYDRAKLISAFAGMPAIPLPIETSGSVPYEATIKYLHDNYKNTALRSDRINQQVISSAIDQLERMKVQAMSDSRGMFLLAVLYQMRGKQGDCESCYSLCLNILELETAMGTKTNKLTAPIALKAVCALGMHHEEASSALGLFEDVVKIETSSVMVPLATAVFADRYVMREDVFNADGVIRLLEAGKGLEEKRIKDLYTMSLLTRYNLKLNEYWSGLELIYKKYRVPEKQEKVFPRQAVTRLYGKYMELTDHCGRMEKFVKTIDPKDHYWLQWWNKKEISRIQQALSNLEASFKRHRNNRKRALMYKDQLLGSTAPEKSAGLWLGLVSLLIVAFIIGLSLARLGNAPRKIYK